VGDGTVPLNGYGKKKPRLEQHRMHQNPIIFILLSSVVKIKGSGFKNQTNADQCGSGSGQALK
jgi:hypothetical protein